MDADDRDIVRAYSQERHIYRSTLSQSMSLETSSRKQQTSVSSRNHPEMLSLFTRSNARLREFEDQTQRAIANRRHEFDMTNYSLGSRSTTPLPNKNSANDKQQPLFPNVTPAPAAKGKKFPNTSIPIPVQRHPNPSDGNPIKKATIPAIQISKGYVPPTIKKLVKRSEKK